MSDEQPEQPPRPGDGQSTRDQPAEDPAQVSPATESLATEGLATDSAATDDAATDDAATDDAATDRPATDGSATAPADPPSPGTVGDPSSAAGAPARNKLGTALGGFAGRIGAIPVQLVVTGVCLVLLLTAIGYRVVADDGQDPMPRTTRASASQPDDRKYTVPEESPGDEDKVRIVEQGFSPIKDSGNDNLVSYGAILENTDRKRAAVVTVSLRIADKRGKSLVGRLSDYALTRVVTLIMPGQRTGIADCVYITSPDVAALRFTVTKVGWLTVDPKRRYSASLKANVLDTRVRKGRGNTLYWGKGGLRAVRTGDRLVVRFEVESDYTGLLGDPEVAVVFRNSKGAIVGGSRQIFDVYSEFPPGTSEHEMLVKYGPPEGIDPSRTGVYPYPVERPYGL